VRSVQPVGAMNAWPAAVVAGVSAASTRAVTSGGGAAWTATSGGGVAGALGAGAGELQVIDTATSAMTVALTAPNCHEGGSVASAMPGWVPLRHERVVIDEIDAGSWSSEPTRDVVRVRARIPVLRVESDQHDTQP
jgi:hypothetical protein